MELIEQYILDRKVEPKLAEQLHALSVEDKNAVSHLIDIIKPSANSLRNTLRLLEEIAHMSSSSIDRILKDEEIKEFLTNPNFNRKTTQAKLTKRLEFLRYPERTQMSLRLQENIKELVKTFGVSVSVPDELEGDSIVVSFRAKSCDEISEKSMKLSEISKHSACKEIYSILLGESE